MNVENAVRLLAGSIILASLALAHWFHPGWLWLTAFVGANLVQSSVTGFCPAEIIFRKIGLGRGKNSCCS